MYSTYYSIPTILDYGVVTCDLSTASVKSQHKLSALLQRLIKKKLFPQKKIFKKNEELH